ncbi:MAG: serine/threonine-protein kinase [Pyrinomonadaceae bacterium]
MDSKNWHRVKAVLGEALEIAPSSRMAFLDSAGLAADMRAEIETLIGFEDESADMMQFSAVEFSKDFIDDDTPLTGRQVGPYEVIRELGLGGMGAVYLATRIDGKFKQQVALKLLKREMNTSALRRHFEQEREILASLDHPNIARLLDAGTTEDNIPFIAMEYVDGLPIDEFCDKGGLDVHARLDLFRQVCAAVEFAHRNLVVHRDLKPSNVLVTHDGVPKLLDFGISKILSKNYENADSATITRMGVMTPSYASPEQLRQKGVTTLSDVYSLGVILFELLSGHRPFEDREHDLREIYDAVIEKEPIPPSSMIERAPMTRAAASEPASANAETRRQNAPRTGRHAAAISSQSVRGDLDNIVLKALRKEPERRYASAGNLSDDIHRHLRGLTVSARPNTFGYRASKFAKRNRAGVASAAIIFLAVIAGIVATLWQASVARAERARAERRFDDVRTLANSFLFEFSPKIENLPGSMPARQLLVTRALEYLDNLSQEAGGDAALQSELATAFEKVGDVQGNPDNPNIGDLKGALASYEKALVIRRAQLAADPAGGDAMTNLANNLEVIGNINLNGGEYDKSAAELSEAVVLRESVVAQRPNDVAARTSLAKALRVSGFVPFYESENAKALELFNRAFAILEGLKRENPNDPTVGYLHANVTLDIGDTYGYLDQPEIAHERIDISVAELAAERQKHPNDNRIRRSHMIALMKRALYYREAVDYADALATMNKSLEIAELGLRNEPGSFQAKRDLVLVNKQRAVIYKYLEKPRESIADFERAIAISQGLKADDPGNMLIWYDMGGTYYDMGASQFGLGDTKSAIPTLLLAIEHCGEVLKKNPAHNQAVRVTARTHDFLGDAYSTIRDYPRALENFRASLGHYNQLKTSGKSITQDDKAIALIEEAMAKIEVKGK